ncbi:TadE/TadG family type IV pilus assembly protein [Serinicoccus profundi]|uniref:TadE/TadG family type IV pilus assembly protein n=1 Tax=Serinicoccus profundi TaxID=1078471 RepID=UPI000255F77A|nr:Tad domain-containing protein [Serinicoccus profundi]
MNRLVTSLRADAERGSILPLIPIMALALLMIAGLVIDASRQLNARSQAVAYAEEAARAGAQAIEPEPPATLDPQEARRNVRDYCAQVLQRQAVTSCGVTDIQPADDSPRPYTMVVRVQTQIPTTLLGMVGVRSLSASGEGRAEPVAGELLEPAPEPDPDPDPLPGPGDPEPDPDPGPAPGPDPEPDPEPGPLPEP